MKNFGVFFGAFALAGVSACVSENSFSIDSASLREPPPPNSDICRENPKAPACDRAPVVGTPGIVTVLFTMNQIPQGSATLILANAIKYASPLANPRILFLKDSATNGEDEGDSDYIRNVLLAGYDVEHRNLAPGGLAPADVAGKDLVILSNPGHPLSDAQTLTTLTAFGGGVILLGDDLAQGRGFSVEAFTGLRFRANGTSVSCNGKSYAYDNLAGYDYRVAMNEAFLPGVPAEFKNYLYGNDIDHTEAGTGLEVLAWARADAATCDIGQVPAVVRRPR